MCFIVNGGSYIVWIERVLEFLSLQHRAPQALKFLSCYGLAVAIRNLDKLSNSSLIFDPIAAFTHIISGCTNEPTTRERRFVSLTALAAAASVLAP